MGKCIFVLLRKFFPFNWRANLANYYFFKVCLKEQLRYATYGRETCCSYLGSTKQTYISMVNEPIFPFVGSAIFFLFSFCLMGHNIQFEIMLMIININNINNNNDSK